jgi:MFS family permease
VAEAATGVPQTPESPRATFREVFANGEFRAIWLAELASVGGDQFARVALTVLVYQHTGSPLLTAVTYAASYLSWVVGGLGLSNLADRYPRRSVMIVCDLVRMVLVAAMVLPGTPLWAMVVLLFAVTTVNAPFQGARSALRATILPGDRYALGLAISQITRQAGNVGGFVAGGVIVAVLGSRDALAIDASTFAFSALLLWAGVRHHPLQARVRRSRAGDIAAGLSLVFGDGRLRTLALLGWLGAFYTVVEALAVPYAARLGEGTVAAGLIFAAVPFGSATGMALFSRVLGPSARLRWMSPMAVAACLVPVACLARPGLIVSLVIFVVSGMFASYQIAANSTFIAAAPETDRGQAYGLANAGLQVGQGVVYVLAGAAASVAAPVVVVAVCGAVGATAAGWLALAWRHQPVFTQPDA